MPRTLVHAAREDELGPQLFLRPARRRLVGPVDVGHLMPDGERERVVEDSRPLHRPLQRVALSYQVDDALAGSDEALDMLKLVVERPATGVSVDHHDLLGRPRQQSNHAGKGLVVLVGLLRCSREGSEERRADDQDSDKALMNAASDHARTSVVADVRDAGAWERLPQCPGGHASVRCRSQDKSLFHSRLECALSASVHREPARAGCVLRFGRPPSASQPEDDA